VTSTLPTGVVTFLFTDVEGSARLDPEELTSARETAAESDLDELAAETLGERVR